MTIRMIQLGSESGRVCLEHTISPSNSTPLLIVQSEHADIKITGTDDEFDIESYSETLAPEEKVLLSDANKWVAQEFYAEKETLTSLRLAAGFSQKKLAEICGMEQPHISRYEAGTHEMKLSKAKIIAKALNVSIDRLALALESK